MDNPTIIRQVQPVSSGTSEVQASFIRKTYLHLALAVLAFMVVEAAFLSSPAIVSIGLKMSQGMTWLLVLGGFMFVTSMADRWAQTSTNRVTQYAALGLYVVAEAFIFVPLIYMAIAMTGDTSLIKQAGLLTMSLFSGLSAVAFLSGKDFSMLRSSLTVGFMIAMGLIVAGVLFGFNLGLWFSALMVVLASGSILYQTSQIMHQYHSDQYVAASLGLFAAFMLLFWYVLDIVMRFSGD